MLSGTGLPVFVSVFILSFRHNSFDQRQTAWAGGSFHDSVAIIPPPPHLTAGASGFLNSNQSGERPDR